MNEIRQIRLDHLYRLLDLPMDVGTHPSIRINKLRVLPPNRRAIVLHRLIRFIEKSKKIVLDDCDAMEQKHTHCSWGMCTNDPSIWRDPEDHIFPVDFAIYGRVTPLKHGHCPLDIRTAKQASMDGNGCFYTCRAFQYRKHGAITKELALELYKAEIKSIIEETSKP